MWPIVRKSYWIKEYLKAKQEADKHQEAYEFLKRFGYQYSCGAQSLLNHVIWCKLRAVWFLEKVIG